MKKLLITIDGSENDEASLRSAIMVARGLEADLDVVHTAVPAETFYAAGDFVSPAIIDNSEVAAAAEKRARDAFETVCTEFSGAEWSKTEMYSFDAIARFGPLSDLVIIERLSQEEGPSVAGLNAALFNGAGPVLITPYEPPPTFAASPVIAWNASRQSALAVKSAIPLLKLAGQVTVLSGDGVSSDSFVGLNKYLDAYGVAMSVERFSSDKLTARGRARALLKAVEDLSGDLLIMGAYGENAVNALFGLGRATRKIVTAARVPTLLQH